MHRSVHVCMSQSGDRKTVNRLTMLLRRITCKTDRKERRAQEEQQRLFDSSLSSHITDDRQQKQQQATHTDWYVNIQNTWVRTSGIESTAIPHHEIRKLNGREKEEDQGIWPVSLLSNWCTARVLLTVCLWEGSVRVFENYNLESGLLLSLPKSSQCDEISVMKRGGKLLNFSSE